MRIGIIGTGQVGSALATGLADSGHAVMLGSRDPAQPRVIEWASVDPDHRQVSGMRAAALFADTVVVAVPGRALAEMLDGIGRDAFEGKTVIDVTNPLTQDEHGQTVGAFGDEDSAAEFLQRELPGASVVKAFNQISAPAMLHPEQSSIDRLRIAGDDQHAKERVTELLESFGWQVRDLGALRKARALERGVIRQFAGT